MLKSIELAQLEIVLYQLGFTKQEITSRNWVRFSHDDKQAVILLSAERPEVKQPHINMIEKTLEGKGVIRKGRFQSLFQDGLPMQKAV
ncbi:hypothetical protein [Candidatus Albibeggiatoa sp. nov. NOAA]|uniref:hypothetical protein n=1 Tax=Candidatus Albibeggiatoa sp. nov. NOAA TaxID=3162724 RepID=UPI0032FC27D1|nr:hypothetical protein [Thiotrichaceae bacterium]